MTANVVRIYGKDTWPYTTAAREDCEARGVAYEYYNVKKDEARLNDMLAVTKGRREVPVIVDDGKVTIGFGGTW